MNHVLPHEILNYFKIVQVQELGDCKLKKDFIEVHLDEINSLSKSYTSTDYEPKGFLSSKRVQGFPLRGKAVYLVIRRRRWRHKETKRRLEVIIHL